MAIKIKFKDGRYKLEMDYDKYKKHGDIHWQWYAENKAGYKTLVMDSFVPFQGIAGGTLVDIGSGDGLPLGLLSQSGFKCSGVEPEALGAELAMRHKVKAEIFIEKAEKFARRGLSFDYLYSLNTIEHLDDPSCMTDIMARIKYFGVIVTDNIDVVPPSKRSIYHKTEFSPSSFEKLFADFNLERINLSDPAYFGFKVWKKQSAF